MAKPGISFEYEPLPNRVVFARGAARDRLPDEVRRAGADRLMVVTSRRDAALARELISPFADRVAVTFNDVRPHVPADVAEHARAVSAAYGAGALLAIGGGSATGTAKAVALTTGLPIVVVPTTYSGSEMTAVWGVTADGRKQTGRAPSVLPRSVVYDPVLLEGLPPGLAAASSLNALAHCMEVVWTTAADPVSVAVALDGVRALVAGLDRLLSAGTAAAVEDLLLGAYLAGSAFAVTGSGLHHKICHVLGGAFDLPHAQLHAVVLPHVLAFNLPSMGGLADRLGAAMGTADPVRALGALCEQAGVPRALRALGLDDDQLGHAADLVAGKLPITNVRRVDGTAILSILRAAQGPVPSPGPA